jgi:hypothetical protein
MLRPIRDTVTTLVPIPCSSDDPDVFCLIATAGVFGGDSGRDSSDARLITRAIVVMPIQDFTQNWSHVFSPIRG